MKFKELRKHFHKKYIIRVVAGALVFSMIFAGGTQFTAYADKTVSESQEISSDTDSLLDEVNLNVKQKNIDKDETVYLISDAEGNVTDTIVSDHLYNEDKASTIDDTSSLTDIENTNGTETFTQDGDKLTWQADGNDIYYQGHSDQEAPVQQKVSYQLDGEDISPEDLAGKSGKVTIRFDYSNNTSYSEKIDGKDIDVVVPFAALTGVVLDDHFSNVQVSNGRVIKNGSKSIAVGYGLPGVKDSLESGGGSFDKDVEMPEYFEITADVDDFELSTAMTAVINAGSLFKSSSDDSLNSLDDDMDDLKDGTDQLLDGSDQLADGLKTLDDSMGQYSDGLNTLATGISQYTDGTSQLDNGIQQIKTGLSPLKKMLPTLSTQLESVSKGVESLKTGGDQLLAGYEGTDKNTGLNDAMDSLTAGAKQLSDGASALNKGIEQISSMMSGSTSSISTDTSASLQKEIDSNLNIDTVLTVLRTAGVLGADDKISLDNIDTVTTAYENNGQAIITALATAQAQAAGSQTPTADQVQTANNNYYQILIGLKQIQAARDAVNEAVQAVSSQLASAASDQTSQAALKALTSGSKQVSDGAASLYTGLTAATAGEKQLYAGTKAMVTGIDTFASALDSATSSADTSNSVSSLVTGLQSLVTGVDKLSAGSSKLVSNNKQLNSGVKKLSDATGEITDGVGQLSDGADQLHDGLVEFNEKGIEKLLDAYEGDLKPLYDRLKVAIHASEDYDNFSGISDGKNGNVKFIYRMAAIDSPDSEDE